MRYGSLVLLVGLIAPSLAWRVNSKPPPAKVLGAKRSKVYHTHPHECSSAKRIDPDNRIQFSSPAEAVKAGRRLCKICAGLDRKAAEKRRKPEGIKKKHPLRSNDQRANSTSASHVEPPESSSKLENTPSASHSTIVALPEISRAIDVLDGGTLVLDNGEKVILLGIICPHGDQPLAKDAVRFLKEQTRGRTLRITYDASPCRTRSRDSLGRLYVYILPLPDGRDLAGELLFQGYAWLDRAACFNRQTDYERHEDAAWRGGRGIWHLSEGPRSRRNVLTGRHAWEFHPTDCSHVPYLTGTVKLTVNEAKSRRLVPCSEYHVGSKRK